MKKVLTLFAILFAMVGTMKVQAETSTVTMTVPAKYNGWYAAIYYEPDMLYSSPEDIYNDKFRLLLLFDKFDGEERNYITQEECRESEASYLWDMTTVPDEKLCYFPHRVQDSENYSAPFCGQIVNNTFSYVADLDYRDRYVGYFLVSDTKVDAGVEWVKLYAGYQEDYTFTFTDEDFIDSNIFGKMELEANADPQNPTDFYTTFYSGGSFHFIVVTPDVEVFTINVDGDLANLVPFTEDTIPATLPVLLRSKTPEIIIARSDWHVAPYEGTNHLASSSEYEQNTSYTLSTEIIDGVETLGFYQCTRDNIPDDKACLNLPAGVSAPHRIAFGTNTATGMENADATDAAIKAEKIMRNGQLLIKKNGLLYNAQGAMVE